MGTSDCDLSLCQKDLNSMEFNSLSKPKSEFQDGELLQEQKQQEQEEKGKTILVSSLTIKTRSLGEFKVSDDDNDGGGFRTPTSLDQRIPVITQCPPAPRKPKKTLSLTTKRKAASRRLMLDLSTEIDSFLADLDGKIKKVRKVVNGNK
ncbi:cyclin-dependent protein kinase inhibitor SMR3-like [Camellia sinensis]|uniref:cyclin-dependent protein kinase inhibitor SMR3-like n=1 Tax=Camellia sinensis TaxID=4442 RepID=UPI00103617D9|nr:cyclin-dependent protein kinase inhibitor SMR3-like [Camellia sinensis]